MLYSMPPTVMPGRGLLGEDQTIDTPDGRGIRAMVRGTGNDLVVLEAGLGISGLYWAAVHEALAASVRVVAYERAGFGGSDPDDHARTLARMASDLETVIDAFPHRRLVLVGHSWGGPIVRTLAGSLADRGQPVSGLVLVDPSDENSDMYFSGSARLGFAVQAALMMPLARLRLLPRIVRAQTAGLAEPVRRAVIEASSSLNAARGTAAEQRHVIEELRDLRDSPGDYGTVPTRVISGLRASRIDAKARASITQAHQTTVNEHAGARLVPAFQSGHQIPITEPALIVAQALDLLDD